jgi:hypothetical protein
MARKLTDAEFVQRTRENNRRRSERQRQRLVQAGRSSLTVWIPDPVRAALTAKAANDGATIADTAAALLSAALAPTPTPTPARPATVDTLPLFDTADSGDGERDPVDDRLQVEATV